MNGSFKMQLADEKRKFVLKKRRFGLEPEILPEEIVIVAAPAIPHSFMVLRYGRVAFVL